MWTRRRLLWLASMLALIALVAVTRSVWLPWPALWLDVSEPVSVSDMIVMPSGQFAARIPKAAELLRHHFGRTLFATSGEGYDATLRVLGIQMTEAELLSRLLASQGIAAKAVTMSIGSHSTYGDAIAFREYVRTTGIHSALIVTSHLHSRRVRWMYRRVLPASFVLTVIEAPQTDFEVRRWWQYEDGMLAVVNEYLKLAFYVVHY
jgi:uncharacterized SAM-binding protein YcdF (DUF218 family)